MDLLHAAQHVARGALRARGVTSRHVPTSMGALHLYDAKGSGALPTIALLHGIGSSAAPFGRVVTSLRPHARRVIAPDAPGHGFSPAPTRPLTPTSLFEGVRDLLDAELSEPAIVFGSSLGGGMALRYALERPERVRALILCSPAGALMSAEDLSAFLQVFRMRTAKEASDFAARLYHRPPWYLPLLAPSVRGLLERPHIRSLFEAIRAEDAFRPEALASLEMPLLLLWGKADRLMPTEHLDFFKAHLPPHARIEEPERFGHSPQLEHPVEVADWIARFASEQLGR